MAGNLLKAYKRKYIKAEKTCFSVENKMKCRKFTAMRKRRLKVGVQERVKGELWSLQIAECF